VVRSDLRAKGAQVTSDKFELRATDNTLSQSAERYVQGGTQLDQFAQTAFRIFATAYINAPQRCTALPLTNSGQQDRLLRLWYTDAKVSRSNLATTEVDIDNILFNFQTSVAEKPKRWAAWALFQFTSKIADEHHSRVPDWRDRLSSSVLDLHDRRTKLIARVLRRTVDKWAVGRQAFTEEFRRLRTDAEITSDAVDAGYIDLARKLRESVEAIALAYCWDWYQRGERYAKGLAPTWLAPHPLRRDAPYAAAASASRIRGPLEVEWGSILDAYLQKGKLHHNVEMIAETLETIRDEVHSARMGFTQQLEQAQRRDSDKLYYDAIADVLAKVKLQPLRVSQSHASSLNRDLREAAAKELDKAFPRYGSLVNFVLGSALAARNSGLGTRIEYALVRKFAAERVWQRFEIPGVQ
jgi:hypothetical protein